MIIPDKFEVWVVDTQASNFEIVVNSIENKSHLILKHIPSADEFLKKLDVLFVDIEKTIPHFVFIDFFLGETFANDVIPQIILKFEAMPEHRPYLIAFSSMPNANDALMKIGADWDILKIKGAKKIPEIDSILGSKEKICKHLGIK